MNVLSLATAITNKQRKNTQRQNNHKIGEWILLQTKNTYNSQRNQEHDTIEGRTQKMSIKEGMLIWFLCKYLIKWFQICGYLDNGCKISGIIATDSTLTNLKKYVHECWNLK